MITNAEIRRRAFRRVKKRYWFLYLVGLATMPLLLATSAIRTVLSEPLGSVLGTLATVLTAPLSYGASAIFLNIWRKKKGAAADLLVYIRNWRLLGQVLLLALVSALIKDSLNILNEFAPRDSAWGLLGLPILVADTWLGARLLLVPYLFISQRPERPLGTIPSAFGQMRGHVWQFIRLVLSLFWLVAVPVLVAVLGIGFMFPQEPSMLPGLQAGQRVVLSISMSMLISFITPYLSMVIAGFADAVIAHADGT